MLRIIPSVAPFVNVRWRRYGRAVVPRDFTGVFSRQFVVGHFLPAFFALAIAAIAASNGALPTALKEAGDLTDKLVVLGLAAFPVGLLLSGAHAHLLRGYTGEASE